MIDRNLQCPNLGLASSLITFGTRIVKISFKLSTVADEGDGSNVFDAAHVIRINDFPQARCFENSGLSLQGRGFSKAMTAKEAQAFVGDVSCLVNTLQDEKLFLDPPSTPPRARSRRQRRDTRPELLDLTVRYEDTVVENQTGL